MMTDEQKAIKEIERYYNLPEKPKLKQSYINLKVFIAGKEKVSAGLVSAYFPDRLMELRKLAAYKRKARGLDA